MEDGDHVVLFVLAADVSEVERLLQVTIDFSEDVGSLSEIAFGDLPLSSHYLNDDDPVFAWVLCGQ